MAIALESDLVTSAQIIANHAKKIDELTTADGTREYTDLVLQEIMNTVIQFILGNAPDNTDQNILKYAIKDLCSIQLSNTLWNDQKLPDWVFIDVFDKEILLEMLTKKIEGEDPSAHIFIYNNTTETA